MRVDAKRQPPPLLQDLWKIRRNSAGEAWLLVCLSIRVLRKNQANSGPLLGVVPTRLCA